ncbi:MAG: glycosyltransferase family 39 protein, partial [Verrucomicrobiaceae bacterium]
MNRQRFLPLALGLVTLVRFLLLATRELSPVEAHAALCAAVPDWWYPLTGPMLPLWMKVSTTVFGMNEFGVRFFAPLLMLGSGWLVWKISRGLFDATTAAWAAILFQITPVVNLAAVNFTNSTLAIAGSTAMLAVLRLALHRTHRFHLHWWAVSGVAILIFFTDWRLGLAMAMSSAGSLTLTRRGRNALLKWPVLPILGVSLVLAITIFLAWNSEHRWTAFAF